MSTSKASRPSHLAACDHSEYSCRQDPLMPLPDCRRGRRWDIETADWAVLLYRGPIVCMKRLRIPYAVAHSQADAINQANAGTEFCAIAVLMEGLDLEDIVCEEELADVA